MFATGGDIKQFQFLDLILIIYLKVGSYQVTLTRPASPAGVKEARES